MFIHPLGLFSCEMLEILRYSPAYGAPLREVLCAALLQDPAIVAALCITPMLNALRTLKDLCLLFYLNHG
jgi:hypothetical protein